MNEDLELRLQAARNALLRDRTIDIITTGAKTGRERRTEIWFMNIAGQIIICGTPSAGGTAGRRSPRDWLANLKANPAFGFQFKESLQLLLPAFATVVTDTEERRRIMSAPETVWYRDQGFSVAELVAGSPIVDVTFCNEYEALNGGTVQNP